MMLARPSKMNLIKKRKEVSKIKKIFWIIIVVALLFLAAVLFFTKRTSAIVQEPFITICHTNPSKSVTLTFMTEQAYNGHLGTPHNAGVGDTIGACDQEEESRLPSMDSVVSCGQVQLEFFNPTNYFFSFDYRKDGEAGTDDEVTGLNIANGPFAGQPFGQRYNMVDVDGRPQSNVHYASALVTFPEDSGTHLVEYRLWRGAENDWYLPWESVEVETNCKPDEQPTPKTEELTPAGPPVCQDGNILALPIAFQVLRTGDTATLTWYKTGGDLVNIYYKEVGQANWTHAVGDVPNVDPSNKYVIGGLVPSVGYIFAIEQHQGCASGQLAQSVVVDGPVYKPVLFTFSYWQWSK